MHPYTKFENDWLNFRNGAPVTIHDIAEIERQARIHRSQALGHWLASIGPSLNGVLRRWLASAVRGKAHTAGKALPTA